MQFDDKGKFWFISCAVAALLFTAFWYCSKFVPQFDRLIHTILGSVTALGMIFCGILPLVKKLPRSLKNRLQSKFTNGHPWIGLLAAWCVLLHTNFRSISYFNVSYLLYYNFFIMVISGMIAMYFRHFQVLKKDASSGSKKKQMAGRLMNIGYEAPMFIHEFLHYTLYIFLINHIWMYLYYGSLW